MRTKSSLAFSNPSPYETNGKQEKALHELENIKGNMNEKSTDMVGSLEKVYSAAVEFLNDWAKGDFQLPSLAQHDANTLKEACLRYESEKAAFLKSCHEIIDSHKP